MKTIIVFEFLLFIIFSVFGEWSITNDNNLDTTLYSLKQKNRITIEYLRKSHIGLLLEKKKLLHSIRFNCAPSFDISRNNRSSDMYSGFRENVSTVLKGSFEINNWNTYFDVNPLKYGYGNTGGIMIPVLSTQKKKELILDTLISIEQKKSFYQVENIFLLDLKSIWGLVIGTQQIEEEILIRKQIDKKIDSTGKFISNFSNMGLISKRCLHLFKLAYIENKMQISILEKRVILIKGQLQNQFFLEESQVNRIIDENKNFLRSLEVLRDNPVVAKKVRTITDCIDSLNLYEIDMKKKYDSNNDFSMKIGPSISTPGSLREISFGAGATFTMSLISKKKPSSPENVDQSVPIVHNYCDTFFGLDSATIVELNQYIEKIEEEVGNIIEELKSGIQYSLPSLTDLYSRIISARTNCINLRFLSLSYKSSNIHSLEEIGLRNELTQILSGSE